MAELNADFAFALDADEFIRAESREHLQDSLSMVPAGHCALVPWQNYVSRVGGESSEINPVRRITTRLRSESKPTHKVVLSRAFASDTTSQVALGNHSALRMVEGRYQPFPHVGLREVRLSHFPVRSAEQIAKKALLGWLSHRLTKPERYMGGQANGTAVPASHWRELFTGLAEGKIAVSPELVQAANRMYVEGYDSRKSNPDEWVEDPLEAGYELRYTHEGTVTALAALANWADRLVTVANSAPEGQK